MSKKNGLIAFHADDITRQYHKDICDRIKHRLLKRHGIETNQSEISRRVVKIHYQRRELLKQIEDKVVEDYRNHP